jgi:hypothetical protein
MKSKIGFFAMAVGMTALIGATALVTPAHAVPSFVRQTNMSCNQCHTIHGGPVPNFTLTGKKFRATGYHMISVRDEIMESGVPGNKGERLWLPYVPYISFRLQSVLMSVDRDATTGKWGEVMTNPTTRLAIFFVGKLGDHFGYWNEWYFHTLGSATQQWSLDLASWDEYDLRWTFNPHNPTTEINLGITNMPVYDLTGFGPFPANAGGSGAQRGEIQGLAHPNYVTAFLNGWMYDRLAWLIGGNTGDTNTGWDNANIIYQLAYALMNTNANELWLHVVGRHGSDVMPLVTQNFVKDEGRDWSYRDLVSGVSDTRIGGADTGPYLSSDIDNANTFEGEIRWSGQDRGPHSFELVGRYGWNRERYHDGAKTNQERIGAQLVYGFEHTYYLLPFFNTYSRFDFTDHLGSVHKINHGTLFGVDIGFKPTENFLVNVLIQNTEILHLDEKASGDGRTVQVYIDYLI